MITKGTCYLVGGGPGDLGLVTLRAKELLEQTDVLVYDSLINEQLLDWVPAHAEKIYAGKRANKHVMKQSDINALLVQKCRENKSVVRLKGGDPFIFGRGGEEAEALMLAGLTFEVVPGVTSGIAAPTYAGIPLTHREHSTSVTFVTGHECPKESGETDWAKLAELGGTLVIYMGVKNLPTISAKLIEHGMSPDLPAAFIQWGCDARQRSISASLADLPIKIKKAGLSAPAIIVIGHVAALHKQLEWFTNKPLHGKKITITRTRSQNSHLQKLLQEQGAHVIEMPLIQITKIPFTLPDFSPFQWLVFTSQNAVIHFMNEVLQKSDTRSLHPLKIAAVGLATARELMNWKIKADFIPTQFNAAALSNEWPEKATKAHVLFPCAQNAHDQMETALKEKGCQVTRLELYETQPNPQAQEIWPHHSDADWILFCSSSAVEYYAKMLAENELPHPETLKIASIGTQTSSTLKLNQLPIHAEASESTLESLVQCLIQNE